MSASDLLPSARAALVPAAARAGKRALATLAGAASFAAEEALRAARAGLYFTSHTIDGEVLPAFKSLSEMRGDVEATLAGTMTGDQPLRPRLEELGTRASAGRRYEHLVHELGGALFGSAVYPGEQVLRANDVYRLSYLPPKRGVERAPAAVFFLAGFIPYGDRLFRFLPEANLYDRFLERGVAVYLVELVGDKDQMKDLGQTTVERQIDWIDELADVAFRHNEGRKLIAVGYCGSGLQLLAYLAARPEDADAKFKTAATFVTPIDAAKCTIMSEMVGNLPRSLLWTALQRAQVQRGYLRGVELWAALDTSLKNVFTKTSLGRFATGWKNPKYAKVEAVSDLGPVERFELAGAYWISVHNAERFPLPVDLVRKATWLYDKGVAPDGWLGFEVRGRRVSLADLASRTSLRVTGFFAGLDPLVQGEAGAVMTRILGERYRQITHPTAAHVSYVCFPSQWDKSNPRAFLPNPIDALLEDYAR